MLTTIRSLLFYLVGGIATVPFAFMVPVLLISLKIARPVTVVFLKMQLFLLWAICGLSYQIQGRENLPDEPYLIASGHESAWETFFFYLFFNNPSMFAKKEIFDYPVVGALVAQNQHISTDRKGSVDALMVAMRKAESLSKSGRNVLIFPGGTRELSSEQVIKKGVLVLYRRLKCPCVPVVLNSGDYWPRNSWKKYPGTIIVRVLPSIPPGLAPNDFVARLSVDMATKV